MPTAQLYPETRTASHTAPRGGLGILEHPDGQVEIVAPPGPPLGTTRVIEPLQVRGTFSPDEIRLNRRARRYQIRDALRGKVHAKGLAGCGRRIIADTDRVEVKTCGEVAHFTGLMTCGSIWACPVCQAKIRHARAQQVEKMLNRALEMGHGIEFVTLTARHHAGQALAFLFSCTQDAWAAMLRDKTFKNLKAEMIEGLIVVREVTHGINGWHPHLHLAVITWRPLTPAQRAQLEEGFWRGWSHQLQRVGLSALRGPGVLVKPCTAAEGLAGYLCKVTADDGAIRSVSMELTRSDLKRAGRGHRSPEQIADDFTSTGDLGDLALLQEHQKATHRRRMMTCSRNLKLHLGLDEAEQTDEELAAAEVGGEVLLRMGRTAWQRILDLGLPAHVLQVAERDGREGLRALMVEIAPDDFWHIVQPAPAAPTQGENGR